MKYADKLSEYTDLSNLVALTFSTTDLSKSPESLYGVSLTTFEGTQYTRYFGNPDRKAIEFENVNPVEIHERETIDDAADFVKDALQGRVPFFVASGSRTWTWPIVKALKEASDSWASITSFCWDLRDIYVAVRAPYSLVFESKKPWDIFPEAIHLSQRFGLHKIAESLGESLTQRGARSPWTSALTMQCLKKLLESDYPDLESEL